MKVWDCFPFFNEFEHVRARTALWRGKAQPLLMEADLTHRGKPKSFLFKDAPIDGVIGQTCLLDASADDWEREGKQRDWIGVWLREHADADDLILSCDADEIVNPARLDDIVSMTERGPVCLAMRLYYYGLHWADPHPWIHAKAMRVRDLPLSLSAMRVNLGLPVVNNAGWHVAWWGGTERIDVKLSSFAHSEFDTLEVRTALDSSQKNFLDPHGRSLVSVNDTLPSELLEYLG